MSTKRMGEKERRGEKNPTRILVYTPCGDVCACRIQRNFPILVKRAPKQTLRSIIVNTEMSVNN